jgi:hypothetical protein
MSATISPNMAHQQQGRSIHLFVATILVVTTFFVLDSSDYLFGSSRLTKPSSSSLSTTTITTPKRLRPRPQSQQTKMNDMITTDLIKDNPGCSSVSHAYPILQRQQQHDRRSLPYTWIGNMWFPPDTIPRYTSQDMISLLRNQNVLWIGESTARQDYFTMYNYMNSTSADQDIVTKEQLDHGLNINKKRKVTENCTLRGSEYDDILSNCRQVPGTPDDDVDDEIVATTSSSTTMAMTGAFDLIWNPDLVHCFDDVRRFMTWARPQIQQYTVIIISVGIWEVMKPEECPNSGIPALQRTLDFLHEYAVKNKNNVHIIWKTHGGNEEETPEQQQYTQQIHQATRDWFVAARIRLDDNDNVINSPLELVDFGTQVLPRTYGENRIFGDSTSHFGHEARLLSLQMITHGIYKQFCSSTSQ